MSAFIRHVALLLLLVLSGCGWVPSPSNVKLSEEPANGLTDSSFDMAYLRQLLDTTRETAEQRLIDTYQRNKVPPAERTSHARTSGGYKQIGNRRLAVIELRYTGNPMRVTRIVGIEGERLVTVSCISPHGEPVDPFAETGECAEGVRRHLSLAQR
jgi:hypothetical protein